MSTHRMNCSETREKLPLFVGGDLDPDVLEGVRAHLSACGQCARRAEQGQATRNLLVAAFRESRSEVQSLWPGLRATLIADGLIHAPSEARLGPVSSRRIGRRRWAWALAPLAAAAALVLILRTTGGPNETGGVPSAPFQPAPSGPEVALPEGAPMGGLRPIPPGEAPQLVPYQRPRPEAQGATDIRAAGYRGRRLQ